jgi:hypothetical protein
MKEEMQGRDSGAIRSFALFGETTGEPSGNSSNQLKRPHRDAKQ